MWCSDARKLMQRQSSVALSRHESALDMLSRQGSAITGGFCSWVLRTCSHIVPHAPLYRLGNAHILSAKAYFVLGAHGHDYTSGDAVPTADLHAD